MPQPENRKVMSNINETTITTVLSRIDCGAELYEQAERGVRQAAALWRESDGSREDFVTFCQEHFCTTEAEKETLFRKLSVALKTSEERPTIECGFKKPVHLEGETLTSIDLIFGGYSPSAHFMEDMYDNKVAFICALNFPNYTLEENTLGTEWTRLEWAYARLGIFHAPDTGGLESGDGTRIG